MKKSTKLLSVLLAILMIFSSMSVMASAYETYNDSQQKVYDSNDKGAAILLTDEQRASWLCDLVNDLLAQANIFMPVDAVIIKFDIDLRSLDKAFQSFNTLRKHKNNLSGLLGDLKNLDLEAFKDTGSFTIKNPGAASQVFTTLFDFLNANASLVKTIISKGSLSAGVVDNFVDLSAVNAILGDLNGFIKSTVYGLGARNIGLGDDPAYPNAPAWDAVATPKPTLDTIVQDLISDLLTQPRTAVKITDKSQNDLAANPEKYNLTAAYIQSETATDGSGDTWYYVWATKNEAGEWVFSESSTTLNKSDKQYLMHWDPQSVLAKNIDPSWFDFSGISLYTLLGRFMPWAYETFGAPNLDGQLRATIMQFLGAFNDASQVTEETKATLKAKMTSYKDKGVVSGDYSKFNFSAISNAFASATGAAGNNNFAYFSLSGKDINTMPDDLYYVVEWNGSWEFYKVNFTGVVGEKADLFKMVNWEWQAPATWAEIMPADHDATAVSSLRNITDAMGKILAKAVQADAFKWTYDSENEDNAHFEDNVMGLVKQVIKTAPVLILGANDAQKADKLDTMTNEQVLVLIGADVMEWLMPALVLPQDVSCLEELIVYGVREFVAEIMPEENWDEQIKAAKSDADYLEIALDMGASIGVYYLKNVMALGTKPSEDGKKAAMDTVPYGADTDWRAALNYIIDYVTTYWVGDLTYDIKQAHPKTFAGNDGVQKLTVLLNELLPGLLSLVDGCTVTIDEGNGKTYDYVSVEKVKDLIAGVLDAKVEPLAKALYRNNTGYGNKSLYAAVIQILKDLTGGLGFDRSNDYAGLCTALDNALAQPEPLNYLTLNAQLGEFAAQLIWTIVDGDNGTAPYVRDVWLQDVLLIVMQATGAMDDMRLTGVQQMVDKQKYVGEASPTITPTVTLKTTGLKSVFYDGGYLNGNFTQDGEYSGVLNKYEILDIEGKVVATLDNINAPLTPNASYSGTSITAENIATADMQLFTLRSYITVTLPDGKTVANNGKPIVTDTNFMASDAARDDTVNMVNVLSNKGESSDVTIKMWNIYVDENTELDSVGGYKMNATTTAQKARKFYIDGFGYLTDNQDGSFTFKADKADAFSWEKTVATEGSETTTETLQPGAPIPFYWAWNNDNAGTEFCTNKNNASIDSRQWYVDTKNNKRVDFPQDFTTYKFSAQKYAVESYGYGFAGLQWRNHTYACDDSPYIILYNSYGLEQKISQALSANRKAENFTPETWAEYLKALKEAIAEYYMAKNAATFITDHTTGGVSDFKTCGENLDAAIKNLKTASVSASTSTDYTKEEKEALNNIKKAIDAQAEKKNLNNQNYYMYRWLKYYNEYAWLSNLYNNAQIPSGIAPNKLAGVPSDNALITSVIKAAAADKQAALNAMVEAPTAEESAAAQQQQKDFTANLPTIDTAAIGVDLGQMAQYETRLIAKPANAQYLTSALTMVASAEQKDYTEQSWARFAAAKEAATAAQASKVPSEIHQARYNLLCAYKGLTAANTDVDLTELEAVMKTVDGIFANPTLYKVSAAGTAAGYKTLDEAMAAVLAEAGVKVELDGTTYFVGGNDTGAAWLAEAGKRTAVEAQATVDRVVKEIRAALANVECSVQLVPDTSVEGNKTEVDAANAIVDGINPGSINTQEELLKLVTTNAPQDYKPQVAVKQAAAYGFGTGTTITVTLEGVDNWSLTNTVVIYGDLNGDGAVDLFDAALLERNLAGKTGLSAAAKQASDANGDGQFQVSDFDMIAQASVGNGTIAQTRP